MIKTHIQISTKFETTARKRSAMSSESLRKSLVTLLLAIVALVGGGTRNSFAEDLLPQLRREIESLYHQVTRDPQMTSITKSNLEAELQRADQNAQAAQEFERALTLDGPLPKLDGVEIAWRLIEEDSILTELERGAVAKRERVAFIPRPETAAQFNAEKRIAIRDQIEATLDAHQKVVQNDLNLIAELENRLERIETDLPLIPETTLENICLRRSLAAEQQLRRLQLSYYTRRISRIDSLDRRLRDCQSGWEVVSETLDAKPQLPDVNKSNSPLPTTGTDGSQAEVQVGAMANSGLEGTNGSVAETPIRDENLVQATYVEEAEKGKVEAPKSNAKELGQNEANSLKKGDANELDKIVTKVALLDERLKKIQAELEHINEDFDGVKNRIDTVGLTAALGSLLRQTRVQLNSRNRTHVEEIVSEEEITEARLRIIEIGETRKQIRDSIRAEYEQLEALPVKARSREMLAKQPLLKQKSEEESELLKLEESYKKFFDRYVEVDSAEHQLAELSQNYRQYIDERVLWVPSASVISDREVSTSLSAVAGLSDKSLWQKSINETAGDLSANTWFFGFALPLILLAPYLAGRLRSLLLKQSELAERTDCIQFRPSIEAAATTIGLAVLVPLALLLIGYRVSNPSDSQFLLNSLGHAIIATAIFILPTEGARQVFRSKGLAESHFGMDRMVCKAVSSRMRWLVLFGVPLHIGVQFLFRFENEEWNNSLGRFLFVVLIGVYTIGFLTLFHPSGKLFKEVGRLNSTHLFYRSRYLVFGSIMLLGVAFLALPVVGYYYTAAQLAERVFQTMAAFFFIFVAAGLSRRWLFVRKRESENLQSQDQNQAVSPHAGALKSRFAFRWVNKFESSGSSEQVRRLLNFSIACSVGFAAMYVWYDVLPALNRLDAYQLWTVTLAEKSEPVPVTLGNVFVAVLLFAATYIGVKNIPGLIELLVLQRFKIDPGSRYAFSTIARYAIFILGTVSALSVVKIHWSQYGWLVAAATVGLGFGMQEIFANLVSGIIVLLERPIRVGDVVTVDGTPGKVTRIQIRATTITNFDGQELIVPNKEFVTGKLLNWTLSDTVNRVMINVGVAYGSNVELVTQTLMKIVQNQPHVMKEPAPSVTFETFGASTLDFRIRCFLPNLDNRLKTIHAIHSEIAQEFERLGIEISFPQQDLHLRSVSDNVLEKLGRSQDGDGFRRSKAA